MSLKYWWEDNDKGKPKYSKKDMSKCHYVHNKFHMNWPQIELGTPLLRGRRLIT